MTFKDAYSVQSAITATDEVARIRGENRARINKLFNGEPLVSDHDAKRMGLRVNVNWGEAPVLGQHGRRQYSNAFLSRGTFFKVSLPDAPTSKMADWNSFITRKINFILKNSEPYLDLHDEQWGGVLIQGYGIKYYGQPDGWLPEYVAIEDFRVSTDTKCSLSNMPWCAIRRPYTEGELTRKVFGKNAMPGWNKEAIQQILQKYHTKSTATVNYTWSNNPEKMAELVRQNGGYYSSDAVPIIPLYDFIYQDEDGKWQLRVVPDQNVLGGSDSTSEFLFESKKPFATERKHFLHIQYGDLNVKTPFLYHSVRSLGFLLMEPCFFTNLTRCRLVQHLHENMNIWLRSSDPNGRAKAQKVELYDRSFLPEGISIVPQTERHQIDQGLAQWAMDDLKSLQKEASIAYTQDTESGQKNVTATAVMAQVSSVNAMMSGLLNKAFRKEKFAYIEICRRLCMEKTTDPDAREFQTACKRAGIPREWLDVSRWEVEPEVPMGEGNPTMELAKAQQLLEMRAMFDGTAQQEILHEATVAITGDHRKADRWVPLEKARGLTNAQEFAEMIFGTLMQGVPVQPKQGLSPIEQIDLLLPMVSTVMMRISQTGGIASMGEIAGVNAVFTYVNQLVQKLAEDRAQKARVKQYSDAVGQLMNEFKAMAQQSIEYHQAQSQQQNGDGEAVAKLQAQMLQFETKAKIDEAKAGQKMAHKEQGFESDQKRKDAQTLAEIQRTNLQHAVDLKNETEANRVGIITDQLNGGGSEE